MAPMDSESDNGIEHTAVLTLPKHISGELKSLSQCMDAIEVCPQHSTPATLAVLCNKQVLGSPAELLDSVQQYVGNRYGTQVYSTYPLLTRMPPLTKMRLSSKRPKRVSNSLMGMLAHIFDWLHETGIYDVAGQPSVYNDLTTKRFVQGYFTIVRKSPSSLRPAMLMHLEDLMDDATDYDWERSRNFHTIWLQHMEHMDAKWSEDKLSEKLHSHHMYSASPLPLHPLHILKVTIKTHCQHHQGKAMHGGLQHLQPWGVPTLSMASQSRPHMHILLKDEEVDNTYTLKRPTGSIRM